MDSMKTSSFHMEINGFHERPLARNGNVFSLFLLFFKFVHIRYNLKCWVGLEPDATCNNVFNILTKDKLFTGKSSKLWNEICGFFP